VLGNMNNSSLYEIWNGKTISNIRNRLYNCDRGFLPCKVCDVDGTLMGDEHVEKWKNGKI